MDTSAWLYKRDKSRTDDQFFNYEHEHVSISRRLFVRIGMKLFRYVYLPTWWLRRAPDPKRVERKEKGKGFLLEKRKFLDSYENEYGFPEGPMSIDQLRSLEFARLSSTTFLDHAGATHYSDTQMKAAMADLSAHLYGNPHSQSDSSMLASDALESARRQVLAFCNASAAEYSCIFTSGATAALKLVGESFPWSRESDFMYTTENHNSVLGIREYALDRGATVRVVDIGIKSCDQSGNGRQTAISQRIDIFHRSSFSRSSAKVQEQARNGEEIYNLFAFPLECNFSGAKSSLALVPLAQQSQNESFQRGRWFVLLDAAKGCSTAPPDLSLFPADFVALSFYKIFGYPTGLGALLVRNDAGRVLNKRYFGGGTVAVSISDTDFMQRREKLEQWLEDGTPSFLSISALCHGFDIINRLTISAIGRHTGSLASYTASTLKCLRHSNGEPVCKLYGKHNASDGHPVSYWGLHCEQGPIVTFNLKHADGSWMGCREVEKLAVLSGIHLRTGCFCNPGACAKYLELSASDMKQNFEAGHVCWDDKDLINGQPTGAVRVSFGYMSNFEDCWELISFIRKFFVENISIASQSKEVNVEDHDNSEDVCVHSISVYPIKSCAGFNAPVWPVGDSGLLYDREWLVMTDSGDILTQKKLPCMCFIQASIDLKTGKMLVQSPNMEARLEVPLAVTTNCNLSPDMIREVRLCGDMAEAALLGLEASKWFTEALGVPCRLVRNEVRSRQRRYSSFEDVRNGITATIKQNTLNFANEGQFLLVSAASVEDLNDKIAKQDGKELKHASGPLMVDAFRFRPNLVVSGAVAYDEDNWEAVRIFNHKFKVLGGCNRCQMVNVDQVAGNRRADSEPLATLASYRRVKGKIFFGLLLEMDNTEAEAEDFVELAKSAVRDMSPGSNWIRAQYRNCLEVGWKVHVQRKQG